VKKIKALSVGLGDEEVGVSESTMHKKRGINNGKNDLY
jgi:hypothetical protein